MPLPFGNALPWYGLIMLVGIGITALTWSKMFRGRAELAAVYMIGLLGALIGAKAGFLIAEGPSIWRSEQFWMQAAVGKTIVGALLGGYIGVEVGKKLLQVHETTGDRFALVVPVGLMMGRVGCLLHGCCLGISCEPGWWALYDNQGAAHLPSPVIELLFNALAFVILALCYRRGLFKGQLFHGYLIAYGLFRIAHEPFRATPRIDIIEGFTLTPYQLLAAVLVVFATWRLWRRNLESNEAALADVHRDEPVAQDQGARALPHPARGGRPLK